MPTLKTAQTAFQKARLAYKTAQDDIAMPGQEKEQMAEQVIALADELVTVAVQAVEGGGMDNGIGNDMGTPGEGMAPPTDVNGTPPPVEGAPNMEDPDKKLNTAKDDKKDGDDGKLNVAKDDDSNNNEVKEMRKELDAMKSEKIAIKLAQKYSELYPVQMRIAMQEAFLSHKEPTALLAARLDEATSILSKPQAIKIAQQEDSVFNFEDLESSGTTIDTRGKI